MNDVKLNSEDLPNKQASAASSSPPKSVSDQQADSNIASDKAAQARIEEVQKEQVEQSQEEKQADIKQAVTQLNDYVQDVQRDLQFNLDDNSGKTVITVVDRNTSEVVRQIPDDVALKLARGLEQDEPLSLFIAKV